MVNSVKWSALLLSVVLAVPVAAQVTPVPQPTDSARRADSLQRVAADTGRRAAATFGGAAVIPQTNQALGVDAEIRIALFEMLDGNNIPAVSRLQWLAASPVALTEQNAGTALRGRQDMLFLLTEGYYRLGVGEPFRQTAQQLLALNGGGQFGTVLQSRLLLDAYRRGDYQRAAELARSVDQATASPSLRGLAALVSGLAAYQQQNFAGARTAFAEAQQAGAPYGDFARYMDALTMLRGDTTQIAPALAALQALAASAQGEFADQVRLTAAMLAYESEQYDVAAQLAGAVGESSGLRAKALLTRAWAQYKANQIAPAGESFAAFATRFGNLPERDEARLMSAQVMLQLGRTQEAAQVFQRVADSAASEAAALQARAGGTMTAAARALVQERAAGLLFLTEPASGKTLALREAGGSDRAVLISAFGGTDTITGGTAGTSVAASAPQVVSLAEISTRLDAVRPVSGGEVPRRLFYTPASASLDRAQYAQRSQALFDADMAVALARYNVEQQMEAQTRQIAMLRALQAMIAIQGDSIGQIEARLMAAQDSLRRVASLLDAASVRILALLRTNLEQSRELAQQNLRIIDSIRTSGVAGREATVMGHEADAAATYLRLTTMLAGNLEGAISRHPAFALRDTMRARAAQSDALLSDTRTSLASARDVIAQQLALLEAGDTERLRSARSLLSAAESQRAGVEGQLVALVESELNARAGELIADLRRDTQAAEFGSASAAFFQALDAGRATSAAPAGTSSGAAGASTAPAVSPQSNR